MPSSSLKVCTERHVNQFVQHVKFSNYSGLCVFIEIQCQHEVKHMSVLQNSRYQQCVRAPKMRGIPKEWTSLWQSYLQLYNGSFHSRLLMYDGPYWKCCYVLVDSCSHAKSYSVVAHNQLPPAWDGQHHLQHTRILLLPRGLTGTVKGCCLCSCTWQIPVFCRLFLSQTGADSSKGIVVTTARAGRWAAILHMSAVMFCRIWWR